MHATPGAMKSLRSSAERIALIMNVGGVGGVALRQKYSKAAGAGYHRGLRQKRCAAKQKEVYQQEKNGSHSSGMCLRNVSRSAEMPQNNFAIILADLSISSDCSFSRRGIFPDSATTSTPYSTSIKCSRAHFDDT